jgi:hypothetical protein
MDEMTGPGEESQKHNSEDAAKYLAESFFGLNLSPADVGGEVLFDDYDDNQSTTAAQGNQPQASAGRMEEIQAFASLDSGSSSVQSAPNRFEENLDDLIVFGDDDDDDDNVSVQDDEEDEDDDENFDFGDEDDEEEDEEEDEDDDEFEDDDDEEDDEEEEDELDDEELDFGADVIDPAPKKGMPVARDSRSGRDDRGADSRQAPSRSNAAHPARPVAESREVQRSPSGPRDGGRRDERPAARSDRSPSRDERPAARDERPAARRDERPPQRGGRPQESTSARSESRGSERTPAKAVDAGRKSPPGDDDYWKELDGWVWDDDAQKKPAASHPVVAAEGIDDEDIDDEDDVVTAAPAADSEEDGESPKRRRGRRRGGRGRGRGRRDRPETSAPAADETSSASDAADFDDFSEILFEEDQEDFVSVSAGSVKAQRRIQDEPPSPAARKPEPVEIDDDDESDDVESPESGDEDRPARSRRGRRGRRGRGKGREETREPVRAEERPAASTRRPVRDEDDMEDDDVEDDDLELSDFGDEDDDEEEVPRRRDRSRAEPARGESARAETPRGERAPRGERPQPGTSGRGRDREERAPRGAESEDRPRRQQPREPRPAVAAGDSEIEGRRGQRPPRVAAEFLDIPTWEEAIGSLAIRTPTEEHARRTENRGRRDGGGRPPRRRN